MSKKKKSEARSEPVVEPEEIKQDSRQMDLETEEKTDAEAAPEAAGTEAAGGEESSVEGEAASEIATADLEQENASLKDQLLRRQG